MVRSPLHRMFASNYSLAMIDAELRAGTLVIVRRNGRVCFQRAKLLHTPPSAPHVRKPDGRAPGHAFVPFLNTRLAMA